MITHPVLIAAASFDVMALFFFASAVPVSARVISTWAPGEASTGQLALERRAEASAIVVAWGVALGFLATALWVWVVAGILPELVRGAMCGTGVMNGLGSAGSRAIWLRLIAVGIAWLWWVTHRLDVAGPRATATPLAARLLLVLAALWLLSCVAMLDGWLGLDPYRPVSCCTAIYGRATGAAATGVDVPVAVGAIAVLTHIMVAIARWRWVVPLSAFAAVLSGTLVISGTLAAYHYGVMDHRCLWCLFLPEHHGVGYLLVAAGGVVLAEAVVPAWVGLHRAQFETEAQPDRRTRRAFVTTMGATLLFASLAAGPALWWRIRFGLFW